MKLSICILTHNRPQQFERCLQSVKRIAPDAEIIVNNDSNDVPEDARAQYYYKTGSLNELYRWLFECASGTHIWFLEDDDIALKSPTLAGVMTVHRYLNHNLEVIPPKVDHQEFQLSQCCIPKKFLDFNNIEHSCNCIFNDWHLVKGVPYRCQPDIIFKQCYNNDNISFPESPNFHGSKDCLTCSWLPPQMQQELKELLRKI